MYFKFMTLMSRKLVMSSEDFLEFIYIFRVKENTFPIPVSTPQRNVRCQCELTDSDDLR